MQCRKIIHRRLPNPSRVYDEILMDQQVAKTDRVTQVGNLICKLAVGLTKTI